MSKDLKSNGGLESIFVPFIEDVTALITKGVEGGTKNFIEFMKNDSKFKVVENPYLQLSTKMLHNKRQTEDEDHLGWASNYDRPFHLNKIDPTKHVFLVGASGWGKTNLLNILMENSLKKNQGIIFIDPKGTKEAIKDFKNLCHYHGKQYSIFSEFDPEAQSFNPIADMTNTQRIAMIMRSFDWGNNSHEYYLTASAVALEEALATLTKDDDKKEIDLFDVYNELKSKHNKEETSGLLAQFQRLLNSDFGKCFRKGLKNGRPSMTMKKAWSDKTCIYIGCSTQGYSQIARTIGKMFVSEAMNLSYWIGRTHDDSHEAISKSIGLFIDEAGSVLYPDFIDLINKCRASGINIYTAVQSYSDIEMIGGGETLMKQLFESYSTWLIQRQTNPENADKIASAFGTFLSQKTTMATDQGSDSGRGSMREAYEYYCHPDLLKSINVGQTILLSHSPKEHAIINVRDFRKSKAAQHRMPALNFTEQEKTQNQVHGVLGDQ